MVSLKHIHECGSAECSRFQWLLQVNMAVHCSCERGKLLMVSRWSHKKHLKSTPLPMGHTHWSWLWLVINMICMLCCLLFPLSAPGCILSGLLLLLQMREALWWEAGAERGSHPVEVQWICRSYLVSFERHNSAKVVLGVPPSVSSSHSTSTHPHLPSSHLSCISTLMKRPKIYSKWRKLEQRKKAWTHTHSIVIDR